MTRFSFLKTLVGGAAGVALTALPLTSKPEERDCESCERLQELLPKNTTQDHHHDGINSAWVHPSLHWKIKEINYKDGTYYVPRLQHRSHS